jgi:hypothetical protein
MTRRSSPRGLLAGLLLGLACAGAAIAQDAATSRLEAVLAGHAVLRAGALTPPPPDAPAEARVSGRMGLGEAAAPGARARNGIAWPLAGQPLQGFSGLAAARAADGTLWAVMDNGYGRRGNSADALLSLARLRPDFEAGRLHVTSRIWLRDPDRRMPVPIRHGATAARYLTGADLDPESIELVDGRIFVGDEFGPWLIELRPDGVVLAVHEAMLDGAPLRARDRPDLPADARRGIDWQVPRSGGFEGLALAPDGRLWALLERPLRRAEGREPWVRALAFDPRAGRWTGESVRLGLGPGARAVGGLAFLDATRALVIERDDGQGHPSRACAEGQEAGCFPRPARAKRLVVVDMGASDAAGRAARLAEIDLMDIADPDGLARLPTDGDLPAGRFAFPFATIEGVMRDGPAHVLVSNDNNLPFGTGRRPGVADASELIRLRVPGLAAAREARPRRAQPRRRRPIRPSAAIPPSSSGSAAGTGTGEMLGPAPPAAKIRLSTLKSSSLLKSLFPVPRSTIRSKAVSEVTPKKPT